MYTCGVECLLVRCKGRGLFYPLLWHANDGMVSLQVVRMKVGDVNAINNHDERLLWGVTYGLGCQLRLSTMRLSGPMLKSKSTMLRLGKKPVR